MSEVFGPDEVRVQETCARNSALISGRKKKRSYPLTEHEIERAEILEEHAEAIEDAEDGMGDRTLHFFREMRQDAARIAEQEAMWTYKAWERFCESDIEKLFLMALISRSLEWNWIVLPSPYSWEEDPYGFMTTKMVDFLGREISGRDPQLVGVLMQVPIHGYRADFVLYGISADCDDKSTWLKFPLVVECDGHDFHNRTKEQAKRDRKRDRVLATHGYQTIRFTGSELWRDPHACVKEALNIIKQRQSEHYDNRHQLWLKGGV